MEFSWWGAPDIYDSPYVAGDMYVFSELQTHIMVMSPEPEEECYLHLSER